VTVTVHLLAEEAALADARTPYATAVVTWARSPEATRPGDRAVITEDGSVTGWVGGPVVHPLVAEQAQRALADGTPRVLHLTPPGSSAPSRPDVVNVPVSSSTEGEIEVFVQPHMPPPQVVAIGDAPMPEALSEMARRIGYVGDHVDALSGLGGVALRPDTYVIVATFGEFDEEALRAVLGAGVEYVALVASAQRSASLLAQLRKDGASKEDLARVRVPEGLAPGSLTHLEVAAAVLADIVATETARRSGEAEAPQETSVEETGPVSVALDPVCGRQVDPSRAAGRFTYDGRTHVFCSSACRRAFEDEPWRYTPAAV
jgi:xanthine dehydrogenase accessory factor